MGCVYMIPSVYGAQYGVPFNGLQAFTIFGGFSIGPQEVSWNASLLAIFGALAGVHFWGVRIIGFPYNRQH